MANRFFSTSCFATVFMALYVSFACFNLYRLMFPLAMLDISTVPEDQFVRPLWPPADEKLHMRVYLSTQKQFTLAYLRDDETAPRATLLWDEPLTQASFSKSFLLKTCFDCDGDASYQFATSWLDQAEQENDGVLGVMSAAGQGIESTSFLLSLYQSLSKAIRSLLEAVNVLDPIEQAAPVETKREEIFLEPHSPLWTNLRSNSTLFVHVMVLRDPPEWPPSSYEQAAEMVQVASRTNALLLDQVGMVKYAPPDHIRKPGRILWHDILYVLGLSSSTRPPWDMEYAKPEYYANFQAAKRLKEKGAGYPYWKPEVSIKYVNDDEAYPADLAGLSGLPLVTTARSPSHPQGFAFTPSLHADEIGLTSEKYIPINETVTSLPLRISFDRNDMDHTSTASTGTAGGISPARWRLLSHLSEAIEAQAEWGFEESDIDDLRRLIADTNITLLAITMLASALHLLFEFLTFKSEVNFWNKNTDLTGLSVRSLFLDMVGQTIILMFLIDKESSLLMIIPSAVGCLIALWKCQRATGLKFVRRGSEPTGWWNAPFRFFGFELRATRLDAIAAKKRESKGDSQQDLAAMTIEADRMATRTLGVVFLPLVFGYTIYTLVMDEYTGWYSWLITSASSAVYALGFVLMTPQLFLNWKLKSVAHLPWRVLVYKSLNTFIDDLFSFIIRMPTMARISCFRDDVVFFVYLYQRWLYPVDTSRPVEGGGDGESTVSESKKKQ